MKNVSFSLCKKPYRLFGQPDPYTQISVRMYELGNTHTHTFLAQSRSRSSDILLAISTPSDQILVLKHFSPVKGLLQGLLEKWMTTGLARKTQDAPGTFCGMRKF